MRLGRVDSLSIPRHKFSVSVLEVSMSRKLATEEKEQKEAREGGQAGVYKRRPLDLTTRRTVHQCS